MSGVYIPSDFGPADPNLKRMSGVYIPPDIGPVDPNLKRMSGAFVQTNAGQTDPGRKRMSGMYVPANSGQDDSPVITELSPSQCDEDEMMKRSSGMSFKQILRRLCCKKQAKQRSAWNEDQTAKDAKQKGQISKENGKQNDDKINGKQNGEQIDRDKESDEVQSGSLTSGRADADARAKCDAKPVQEVEIPVEGVSDPIDSQKEKVERTDKKEMPFKRTLEERILAELEASFQASQKIEWDELSVHRRSDQFKASPGVHVNSRLLHCRKDGAFDNPKGSCDKSNDHFRENNADIALEKKTENGRGTKVKGPPPVPKPKPRVRGQFILRKSALYDDVEVGEGGNNSDATCNPPRKLSAARTKSLDSHLIGRKSSDMNDYAEDWNNWTQ